MHNDREFKGYFVQFSSQTARPQFTWFSRPKVVVYPGYTCLGTLSFDDFELLCIVYYTSSPALSEKVFNYRRTLSERPQDTTRLS